jgi:hypothetical protein
MLDVLEKDGCEEGGRRKEGRQGVLTHRLLVHLVRFAILVIGLLVMGELAIGLLSCQYVEYANPLKEAASCGGAVLFYFRFFVPDLLPFHLVPAAILAFAGTIVWARLKLRRP